MSYAELEHIPWHIVHSELGSTASRRRLTRNLKTRSLAHRCTASACITCRVQCPRLQRPHLAEYLLAYATHSIRSPPPHAAHTINVYESHSTWRGGAKPSQDQRGKYLLIHLLNMLSHACQDIGSPEGSTQYGGQERDMPRILGCLVRQCRACSAHIT